MRRGAMHPALRDRVPGWLQRSLNHGALIVVLSLTPLLAGALSAQVGPPPEPLPLSLRAALERALEASEEVRIAEGELRSARGQKTADRKSTRLNSSHVAISYAVFCLKKKTK